MEKTFTWTVPHCIGCHQSIEDIIDITNKGDRDEAVMYFIGDGKNKAKIKKKYDWVALVIH